MFKTIKAILLILLVAIFWLPAFQERTHIFNELNLKGVFITPSKPKIVLDSLMSLGFQKQFEEYLKYNCGFRGLFVKIRNSVNYILFRELVINDYVAGKEGVIFARASIEQTDGVGYLGKEKIEKIIDKIVFFKNELEKKGVRFLTVLAPSKEFVYPDYLPNPYASHGNSENNYSEFVRQYKKNNLPLINFCTYFKFLRDQSKYSIFTKTGLHWSMYDASLAQDSLLRYIQCKLAKSIPKYRCLGIEISDTARESDADFEYPLNLFFSLNQPQYFYRKFQMIQSTEKNYRPKVIIIGDSFFEAIKNQKMLNHVFSENSKYWYYFKVCFPLSDDPSNVIEDENVLEELESADFVILVANVGTLDRFPYGVSDYYYDNFSNSRKQDFENKEYYNFRAANNKYVCADGARNNIVVADRKVASAWETFLLFRMANNKCAMASYRHNFLSAELGQQNEVTATRVKIADWETFTIVKPDSTHVAFKAANGKYLTVDEKSLQLFSRSDSIGVWEKFEMIPVKR